MALVKPKDLRHTDFPEHWVDLASIRQKSLAQVEQFKHELAMRYSERLNLDAGEALMQGDLVTLKISSDQPRFNKSKLPLKLGAGHYAPALEEALLNFHVGQSGSLSFRYKDESIDAEVEVLSAERLVPAELNDAFIYRVSRERGQDPSDYCDHMHEYDSRLYQLYFQSNLQEEFLRHAYAPLVTYLAKASDIQASPEAIAEAEKQYQQALSEQFASEGVDELEGLRRFFSKPEADKEELDEAVRKSAEAYALTCAYAHALAEADQADISSITYEAELQAYAHQLAQNSPEESIDLDQLRQQFPFEAYCRSQELTHLSTALFAALPTYLVAQGYHTDGPPLNNSTEESPDA